MPVKRGAALLLCAVLTGMVPTAAAAGIEATCRVGIVPEAEQGGSVAVYDLVGSCLEPPGAGVCNATGSLAIENPYDRAFIIADIRLEAVGDAGVGHAVFFTLNRMASHCSLPAEGPNPALSLEAYREAGAENRSLIRRMTAGTELIPARSVKHYSYLELLWLTDLPESLQLNLFITLRPVGVEGVVFLDTDGDGRQSADERGIVSAKVVLYSAGGEALEVCDTDHRGYYRFASPEPGDYYIEATLPAGYAFGGRRSSLTPYRSEVLTMRIAHCLRRDMAAGYAGLDAWGGGFARLKRVVGQLSEES